jgi:cellulose biosynthesis protein BcsQ
MGNYFSCPEWMVEDQIIRINNLLCDFEAKIKENERELVKTLQDKKNKTKDEIDAQRFDDLLHQLARDKRNLSNMFVYLKNIKSKLKQTLLTVQSSSELESTSELINYVSGFLQQGGNTNGKLATMFEIMGQNQEELFELDNKDGEPDIEEIIRQRVACDLPQAPKSNVLFDQEKKVLYQSI